MPEVLTEVDLPDDWGLMKAVCVDGQHRFLPDAPRCGCGEIINPEVERERLERAVIEAAKKWVGFYNGSSEFFSDTKLADAINELIEFESNQQQVKK